MTGKPFWETKTLEEMSHSEWESLCDGCGKCCIVKLEDEDTGALAYTRLHCKLFDGSTCMCSDYANRKQHVPDCVQLTPVVIEQVDWLPKSCAYRLVQEGKPLPAWHHLVCGDRERIHELGHSVRGQTVSEDTVFEEDEIDWVIDWEGTEP